MAHEAHGLLQVRPYAASRRSPHVPTFACEAVLLVVAAYLLAPCGVTFVAATGLARRAGARRQALPDDEGFWDDQEEPEEEATAVARTQRIEAQRGIG